MDCRRRPATETDREFLYRLHCRTMREVIERTWGWDDDWQLKDFDRRIGAYQVFVIAAGQEPIGGLMLDPTPDNLDIVELQILPEHQRKGIGGVFTNELSSARLVSTNRSSECDTARQG